MDVAAVLNDLNAAERAFERVKPELEALPPADFTAMNIDVVSATSSVLGVADRIVEYRDRLAELPEYDIRNVDGLVDYATAAWYVFVTNLGDAKPEQFSSLLEECTALRARLLNWAEPLAAEDYFDEEAVAKIKDGSGYKDVASDVVALVGLYRGKWTLVENLCSVTEADLDRGAQIGPYLFAMVSKREQKPVRPGLDSQRVRAAWTLLDRAYDQCRRGLNFLLWKEGELDRVAPSLRRNASSRSTSREVEVEVASEAVVPPAPNASNGSSPIGGGDGPFAAAGE